MQSTFKFTIMNKKHISLIAAILFSLLFFRLHIGLNMLLFSVLTTVILAVLYPNKFKNIKTIGFALFFLLSSLTIFFYNSSLAIMASVISFFILLGTVVESKSSIYVQILNGLYTTIASVFIIEFERFQEESSAVKKREINYLYWLKMIGIPLVFVSVFILLYRSANPYFDEIINKIDVSFINIQWLLFTVMGYFLMINITNPVVIETVTSQDLKIPNILTKKEEIVQATKSLLHENQLGIVLFIVLNGLLIFFLSTDVVYLSKIIDLKAQTLSKIVHEGIYALITSIVFAITIILYFFRGDLNFFTKNRNLRFLTFTWIVLNIILVGFTSYKNYLYVTEYGFTYKRIGVFVYLLLSLIGLITTYIKVYKVYNLWYLFRKNVQVGYVLLVISATINWDALITNYNIKFANNTDVNYLIHLSDNNTFLLKKYAINNLSKEMFLEKERIDEKYQNYIKKLSQNDWQELVYDNLKFNK